MGNAVSMIPFVFFCGGDTVANDGNRQWGVPHGNKQSILLHDAAMDALVAALVEKNHLKGDEIDTILRAHISK